jgi:competence protein ComEC
MRDSYLLSIVFGFIAGVFLRSFHVFSIPFVFTILIIGILILLSTLSFSKKSVGILVGLIFISFSAGILRFHISDKSISQSHIFPYKNLSVKIVGVVETNPDRRENSTKFEVEPETINGEGVQGRERVLVNAEPNISIAYGDKVEILGHLEVPKSFENDLGKTFDYVSYLKKDGIYFIISHPNVKVTGHDAPSFIKSKLFTFQNYIIRALNYELPSPENSLISGILLGTKSAMSSVLRDEFIKTGTIHIVALSGYNVTILAIFIMAFFRQFFSLRNSTVLGMLGIIFFVIMTGAGSTVVRAAIMAIIVLLARIIGRQADIGRALVIAGFFMILFNPWILVFDVSFQLSFLATIGLVYLTPKVKPWVYFLTEKFEIREIVASTIATNIFVMPFIIYEMGIFSLVSLPANLLILPLMPLTMLAGAGLVLVHSISTLLAIPVSFLTYAILHYELWVTHTFAHLPFSAVEISRFPLSLAIALYILLLFWMFRKKKEISSPA